ncbi:MAG: hypothetical protein U5L96_16560 [Owenweeksia sp.]|nr:hypothetical protein [Owenweeksia sp.]
MENLFDQRIKLYQQREFSQKISATFTFVRQCTKSYFKAQLAIAGPVTLLLVILMATFFNTFMDFAFNMSANPNQDPGYLFSVSYFLNLAAISLLSLLMISTILLVNFSFLRLYHQKDRQAPEVREVYSLVLNRLPRALLVLFLWFLLIMAGFLVFILPGIYLAVVATLSIPVLVIEDTGVSKAFSRPFRLIKEKWWSTFGLIIVMGILGYFIALAFSIPGYIAFFADSFLGLSDGQPMAEAGQSPFSSWTMGIYMLFAYIGQLVSSCLCR